MDRSKTAKLAIMCFALALSAHVLVAQTTSSSITRASADASGLAIINATVSATNTATNVKSNPATGNAEVSSRGEK